MAYEKEKSMQSTLIEQLTHGESQWVYRDDLHNEEDLWQNLKQHLEENNTAKLDGVPLTVSEFNQVKNQLTFATTFKASQWIAGENGQANVHVQREDVNLEHNDVWLTVMDSRQIAGGSSVYEIIQENQRFKANDDDLSRNRRFDVTLLINGLPLIQIELKNHQHPYMDAFRQIQKYIDEGRFNGIYSAVQMFVVSNGVETRYIAASREKPLNAKFLTVWLDQDNKPMPNLLDFAKAALSIPMAHELVTQYAVLDNDDKKLILLRPYQINAIKKVKEASRQQKSGYIWHTTGSGKTLTSYKVSRDLLQIPSIDKTIFLIDRKDLDTQSTMAFQTYAENDVVDVQDTANIYNLKQRLLSPKRQLIVTTRQKLQTLIRDLNDGDHNNKDYQRLRQLHVAFVVDECHRTISPGTQRKLNYFFNNALWYGFTGTPRFDVNSYPVEGDLPTTTEGMYGACLHKYTIKEAIHDGAVLGFQVEHLGPNQHIDDKDGEDLSIYQTPKHMLAVADTIINQSAKKFKLGAKMNSYNAILTTSSIRQAQKYYQLFQDIKNGKSELKISENIKKLDPDFPRVAITYSVGENGDGDEANQTEMKKAMDDYNCMFGTHYTLTELNGYNRNINDRLSRKKAKYATFHNEQLDLVIVVDRLLTGFDAPCMSTLFIDRQPMNPHNLIQAFSRTNRLFDNKKIYGNIVTFQSPKAFKSAVDDAVSLFSNGAKLSEVIAPDWDHAEEDFKQSMSALRNLVPTPEDAAELPKELDPLKNFIKLFQAFDRNYYQLQCYSNYAGKSLVDYGMTDDEYSCYKGAYQNALDAFKAMINDNTDDQSENNTNAQQDSNCINTDYELLSVDKETIDYEYILSLMEAILSDDSDDRLLQNNKDKIQSYINELKQSNPKRASILEELWQSIQAHPERYSDYKVHLIEIFNKRIQDFIEQKICDFSKNWHVVKNDLWYIINHYHQDSESIPGLETLVQDADYTTYKNNGGELSKLKYRKQLRLSTKKLMEDELQPLII